MWLGGKRFSSNHKSPLKQKAFWGPGQKLLGGGQIIEIKLDEVYRSKKRTFREISHYYLIQKVTDFLTEPRTTPSISANISFPNAPNSFVIKSLNGYICVEIFFCMFPLDNGHIHFNIKRLRTKIMKHVRLSKTF